MKSREFYWYIIWILVITAVALVIGLNVGMMRAYGCKDQPGPSPGPSPSPPSSPSPSPPSTDQGIRSNGNQDAGTVVYCFEKETGVRLFYPKCVETCPPGVDCADTVIEHWYTSQNNGVPDLIIWLGLENWWREQKKHDGVWR